MVKMLMVPGNLKISDQNLVPSSLDDLIFSGKSDQNSKSTKDILNSRILIIQSTIYSFPENFSERKLSYKLYLGTKQFQNRHS